ncbi:glutaredoxin 3 [Pyruvatibacter mobilis]|jgi:glutaredoxin 3|uniref:Glutaredoxin n=1 Tax=Pyruvatibacter mobilis TaxID=1712261 RepID=A0A845Q7L8_9HYPH|nr:glutaredoxin 3 [Pyruvatibacter mobilis]NBG94602.1 glutaredoxin 3 [Pyruvatibacter mobilis]QJD74115.1 glutaredoxin 3 [Pyruvatibacter mobilis]GGD04244.1 glutaredoxin 3 [Pyruvatibacter mobilis]
MSKVQIYTTQICPYCHRAKALLREKGVSYDEVDVMATPGARDKMINRTGRTSVPQIFIGDTHVGGCDDLFALDAKGALDPMLAG